MGQVDKNITCPIFFLAESRVQPVYQLNCLIDPCGSKIFAVKNQFFRKDRTDDLPLLDDGQPIGLTEYIKPDLFEIPDFLNGRGWMEFENV